MVSGLSILTHSLVVRLVVNFKDSLARNGGQFSEHACNIFMDSAT